MFPELWQKKVKIVNLYLWVDRLGQSFPNAKALMRTRCWLIYHYNLIKLSHSRTALSQKIPDLRHVADELRQIAVTQLLADGVGFAEVEPVVVDVPE